MIRKGRLHRPCERCNKTFEPTSRNHKICKNCIKKNSWLDELYKKQNERLN